MSIPSTIIVLLAVCSLWSFFSLKCNNEKQKKIWRNLNRVLFPVWFVCIIYMTIFSRGNKTEINLIPFRFILEPFRTGNEEFFRTGWMNILLFVPGGLWLSYATKKQTAIKRVAQIFLLISISIIIEAMQWYYELGTVETDDLICNSLGAIIGVTADVWARKILDFLKNITQKAINCIKGKINKPR